jgi:hypothetical protein
MAIEGPAASMPPVTSAPTPIMVVVAERIQEVDLPDLFFERM